MAALENATRGFRVDEIIDSALVREMVSRAATIDAPPPGCTLRQGPGGVWACRHRQSGWCGYGTSRDAAVQTGWRQARRFGDLDTPSMDGAKSMQPPANDTTIPDLEPPDEETLAYIDGVMSETYELLKAANDRLDKITAAKSDDEVRDWLDGVVAGTEPAWVSRADAYGISIRLDDAYAEYAREHDLTVDMMSDRDRRLAFQQAALRHLDGDEQGATTCPECHGAGEWLGLDMMHRCRACEGTGLV